jgi:hypothetical protein
MVAGEGAADSSTAFYSNRPRPVEGGMKAISLWQPWASLCVIGAKHFETRHWATPHRGPILIHAAKKWNTQLRCTVKDEPFATALKGHVGNFSPGSYVYTSIPLGMIVGVCDIVQMYEATGTPTIQPSVWWAGGPHKDPFVLGPTEMAFGDFHKGRWAWRLENPRRFPQPIPYRGRQQLFDVPDEIVAEQMARAVAA